MPWCTDWNSWLTDEGAQSTPDLVSGMIQSKQPTSFSLSLEMFCLIKLRSMGDTLKSLALHNLITCFCVPQACSAFSTWSVLL